MDSSMHPRILLSEIIGTAVQAAVVVVLTGEASAGSYASIFDKTVQHNLKPTGQEWVKELLDGPPGRFYNQLGMHKHVFHALLEVLQSLTGFGDTRHVSAEE